MNLKHITFILINVYVANTNGSVFLWSNKEFQLSPLQPFGPKEFTKLVADLNKPKVNLFKTTPFILSELKHLSDSFYSAYNPNGNLHLDSDDDIWKNYKVNSIENINSTLTEVTTDFLIIIDVTSNNRLKRDSTKELLENKPSKNNNTNTAVIYINQNVNSKLYALLYSSRPLLLKINDSDPVEFHLGKTDPDMVIFDTRLNVNVIPLEGGPKITLRFSFTWLNGYWYLPSVKIAANKDYNLTTDENIMAPAHFSYHCNGETTFYDNVNGVELHIYDIQVQADSNNGKFGDANDCVSFMTAPIWSGLFVTTLLGIGLIVALTAIMDIKTMDKFDNYKTKNLTITVSD